MCSVKKTESVGLLNFLSQVMLHFTVHADNVTEGNRFYWQIQSGTVSCSCDNFAWNLLVHGERWRTMSRQFEQYFFLCSTYYLTIRKMYMASYGGVPKWYSYEKNIWRGIFHIVIYKRLKDVLLSLILKSLKIRIKQSKSTQISRIEFQPHLWKTLWVTYTFMMFYKVDFILSN